MIIEGVPQFSSPNLRDNREKRSNALPEGHALNSICRGNDMAVVALQMQRTQGTNQGHNHLTTLRKAIWEIENSINISHFFSRGPSCCSKTKGQSNKARRYAMSILRHVNLLIVSKTFKIYPTLTTPPPPLLKIISKIIFRGLIVSSVVIRNNPL